MIDQIKILFQDMKLR